MSEKQEDKFAGDELVLLAHILQHISEAALVLDPIAGVSYASASCLKVLGKVPQELLGARAVDFIEEGDVPRAIEARMSALATGHSGPLDLRGLHGDGNYRWFEAEWWRLDDPGSGHQRVVLHLRDIEDRMRNSEELDLSRAQQNRILQHGAGVIAILDPESGLLSSISPSVQQVLGWRPDQISELPITRFIHPENSGAFSEIVLQVSGSPSGQSQMEIKFRHSDNTWRVMELRLENLVSEDSGQGLLLYIYDVTERRIALDELSRQQRTDSLTGLANRFLLLDRIDVALEAQDHTESRVVLLKFDIDKFGMFNDALGHDFGDELLREFARRLRGIARTLRSLNSQEVTIARTTSDEFALLVSSTNFAIRPAEIVEELRHALLAPFSLTGSDHVVTACIGVAVSESDCSSESLARDASTAMHFAKSTGVNQVSYFNSRVREAAIERLETQSNLVRAIDREELLLHFQPAYDTLTGFLESTEALVRWQHPERGLLGPQHFIPDAESSNRIIELGRWVIDHAARTAVTWMFHDPESPRKMWVNVSALQLQSERFAQNLSESLRSVGLPTSSFGIEITESVLLVSDPQISKNLDSIHQYGISIALDDFGTGYSSLTYLQRYKVDAIKIDQSFVSGLNSDADATSIVVAVNGLGRSLNLSVIAEGVETLGQLDALIAMGCTLVSGFGLCRPLPEAELLPLLNVPLQARRLELGQIQ
ncbi:MAG: EAL domain-containing protein [Microthrixaceae bacterium]